jgi:hypothetical protein
MNKVLPVDVNIYSSQFDFGIFLDINFDKHIENYPHILNSQNLYLKYKNKYIQQTIKNNDQFINMQILYSEHSRQDTFSFDIPTKSNLKSQMKTLFKHQKKSLDDFIEYTTYLVKNSQT